MTLRALRAAERATAGGVLALSLDDFSRIAVRTDVCTDALRRSMRYHGEVTEILTSQIAGETNSETQPWVALGLMPIVDERIEQLLPPQ